jgi:hypothetical protein
MKKYRLCGRYRNEPRDQHFDTELAEDTDAQAWVKSFCAERPSFRPARLVEILRPGDYRQVPLPVL